MNESGERIQNDKAARSTTTEIRQPICAIARGALSLREPLKHIVKKRVRPTRHCEPTGRANARPMTGCAKQSTAARKAGLLRRKSSSQ
jgi:hypothetical protein